MNATAPESNGSSTMVTRMVTKGGVCDAINVTAGNSVTTASGKASASLVAMSTASSGATPREASTRHSSNKKDVRSSGVSARKRNVPNCPAGKVRNSRSAIWRVRGDDATSPEYPAAQGRFKPSVTFVWKPEQQSKARPGAARHSAVVAFAAFAAGCGLDKLAPLGAAPKSAGRASAQTQAPSNSPASPRNSEPCGSMTKPRSSPTGPSSPMRSESPGSSAAEVRRRISRSASKRPSKALVSAPVLPLMSGTVTRPGTLKPVNRAPSRSSKSLKTSGNAYVVTFHMLSPALSGSLTPSTFNVTWSYPSTIMIKRNTGPCALTICGTLLRPLMLARAKAPSKSKPSGSRASTTTSEAGSTVRKNNEIVVRLPAARNVPTKRADGDAKLGTIGQEAASAEVTSAPVLPLSSSIFQ
mmetsp:Transcript_44296/g.134256  ORF Transcript_44296/g.134256 Transcript_44296/m.134256 type:complete len:413 (+) Transcript_44296:45-1283(+)